MCNNIIFEKIEYVCIIYADANKTILKRVLMFNRFCLQLTKVIFIIILLYFHVIIYNCFPFINLFFWITINYYDV